jgi:plastocyanin
MDRRITALFFAALAASVVACGGGGGGSVSPPSNNGGGGGGGGGSAPTPVPTGVPTLTIGMATPSGTIGTVSSSFGIVGGYTQQTYSQVLAFAPGTTVTIKNLSSTSLHTLNVLSTTAFPAQPATISTSASGGSNLASGFATGNIAPGGTMQVTLNTPGTYFIGCAYHFNDAQSMRDVLMVSASATPGPQATPQPSSGGGGGGSGCGGTYC